MREQIAGWEWQLLLHSRPSQKSGECPVLAARATISERVARNGRYPPVTGQLAAANIVSHLKAGDDPNKTFMARDSICVEEGHC